MTAQEEMLTASERREVRKVAELLKSDRELANARGAYDMTPLHWAAEKNDYELAECCWRPVVISVPRRRGA